MPNLSIFRGNGSGVYDDTPIAPVLRLQRQHASGGLRDTPKRSDEVDLDDPVKLGSWKVAYLAGLLVPRSGFDRTASARAIHENSFLPERSTSLCKTGTHTLIRGHVHGAEHAADVLCVDPLCFYYSMVGACEHFLFGRYAGRFVFGIDEITPQIRDSYIEFVCEMTSRMLRSP